MLLIAGESKFKKAKEISYLCLCLPALISLHCVFSILMNLSITLKQIIAALHLLQTPV